MNTDQEIMVSIVIPVYNNFSSLKSSVLKAKVNKEILLIDDGSEDNSPVLCSELASKYPEIRYIRKKHTGVSDTRNTGIRAAKGKYILYLDADDELSSGSIENLVIFFDMCYDAVDLVTYPIETLYNGYFLPPHFRYETMRYSGIYDLEMFPYIGQTTMNIMVKNLGENNILFDTSMDFSEDQMYCCEILQKKLKMGFCKEASYIYHRSEETSSGKLSGSCYIFEQSMNMFEKLFCRYKDNVPLAFQGLYINDLAWKLCSNILYPYHYNDEDFKKAEERICSLLQRVDNDVIWNHPNIDYYHKCYWLSQKKNSGITAFFNSEKFGIRSDVSVLIEEENATVVISRIRNEDGTYIFRGYLRSGVFSFSEKPELFAITSSGSLKIELYDSAYCYHLCHTKTNCFYAFCLEIPVKDFVELKFSMRLEDVLYPCTLDFLPKSQFSKYYNRKSIIINGCALGLDIEKNCFFNDKRDHKIISEENCSDPCIPLGISALRRKARKLRKKNIIHLYLDCRGVEKDNGYYRFLNDFYKNDGIKRYYVGDPSNKNYEKYFDHSQKNAVIMFGSSKHKLYTLAASRIITAFIEDNNLLPFTPIEIPMISDLFDFTVEYIQHGLLHACMPWKYSPEVVMADKVCISTFYEYELFTKKYHFRKNDIIKKMMPRLELLDRKIKPQKKILFAPSWREYLIGKNINGKWQPFNKLFLSSDYYSKIVGFLESKELFEWLDKNDYILEFKLHPIFEVYKNLFPVFNERVRLVHLTDKIEQYEYFITDFSSFAFDFIYLGRPVFSYIPDEIQYRCGMNAYRETESESAKYMITIKNVHDLCNMLDNSPMRKDNMDFFEENNK